MARGLLFIVLFFVPHLQGKNCMLEFYIDNDLFDFAAAVRLTKQRETPAYCPGERVVFECTVLGSALLEWRITPSSQRFMEWAFLKFTSSLHSSREISWPGLSTQVLLTYISRNSTSMTSTAEVIAASEFHRAQFTCSGDTEKSLLLQIAG